MTDIYDDVKIQKIISSYKKQRERDRIKYINRKDNDVFIEQNKARSKAHYEANKPTKSKLYQDNKEFLKCRSLFNYYRFNNRIDEFRSKYPTKVSLLHDHGLDCV
tara:strand:+ start:56 stop:370 length:315 start_codon:yes stop_codon:yes gene_type:complete